MKRAESMNWRTVVPFVLLAIISITAIAQTPVNPSPVMTEADAQATAECAATTDPIVCRKIAERYADAYDNPAEQLKAIPFRERACRLGPNDCDAAGRMWSEGFIYIRDNPLIEKSDAKATEMFKLGCDQGSFVSCDYYIQFVAEGRAGKVSRASLLELIQNQCPLDGGRATPAACYQLGLAHSPGGDLERDDKLAMTYIEMGCDQYGPYLPGARLSCAEAGRRFDGGLLGVENLLVAALQRYETACKMGNNSACVQSARLRDGEAGAMRIAEQQAFADEYRAEKLPGCKAVWDESVTYRDEAVREANELLAEVERREAESDMSHSSLRAIRDWFNAETDRSMNTACVKILEYRERVLQACATEDRERAAELLLDDARQAYASMTKGTFSGPQGCFNGLQRIR